MTELGYRLYLDDGTFADLGLFGCSEVEDFGNLIYDKLGAQAERYFRDLLSAERELIEAEYCTTDAMSAEDAQECRRVIAESEVICKEVSENYRKCQMGKLAEYS